MKGLSRRDVLAGAAAAGLSTAGCLGRLDLDSDPPPLGIDERDVDQLLATELPKIESDIRVGVDPDHVERGVDRVEALLAWESDDLAEEIPNEAVRQYIESEREDARERLDQVSEIERAYARLGPLGRARQSAAAAEGAHAAALDDRVREDVYAAMEPADDRRRQLTADLSYVGDDSVSALVIYDGVERRLDSAESRLDRIEEQSPLVSEVEAVGDASEWLERAEANLDNAAHILQRQREAVSDGQRFDETFEAAAGEFLTEQEDRLAELPSRDEEPADLFDAPVEDTPRVTAARGAVLGLHSAPDRVQDRLAEERPARALMAAYRFEYGLGAADRLVERVEDGGLDRPEDGDAVRVARENAIEAAEGLLDEPEYPYLVRSQADHILSIVRSGDHRFEWGHRPDSDAVQAAGYYAVAIASARALPAASERIVEAIS